MAKTKKKPNPKCKKCIKIKCTCAIGRPTKKTPVRVSKLIEAFEWNANVTEACKHAGIATITYYDWYNTDADFSCLMDAAHLSLNMVAKQQHAKGVIGGDPKHVFFQLSKKAKDPETGDHEYSDKQVIKHEGVEESALTEEEKDMMKKHKELTDDKIEAIEAIYNSID